MTKENPFDNYYKTVFGNLDKIKEVQNYKKGYGEGGFVVIKAKKLGR